MKNYSYLIIVLCLTACSDNFLEEKPDKSLVVPKTLQDMENLLNNSVVMNFAPGLAVLGVDDFFVTEEGWLALGSSLEQNAYTWESDVFKGTTSLQDWTEAYKQIYYCNVILDLLPNGPVAPNEEMQYKNVKGRALFHRAYSLYALAQLFCKPYHPSNVNAPGIPVPTSPDLSIAVNRGTVGGTYAQILSDLLDAAALLTENSSTAYKADRAAANAMLARVYVSMANYSKAEQYASFTIESQDSLIDYNTLNPLANRPIARLNIEVLFQASSGQYDFPYSALVYMDTTLYDSYAADDLRKKILFRKRANKRFTFKGSYTGNATLFTGIAINEIYLTRAECRARLGNAEGALQDLNYLLKTRWEDGTFVEITETNPQSLLAIVLQERGKELLFRPERWTDIRRLNFEASSMRTLRRKLKGVIHELPPQDNRFVYPIPQDEINLNQMEQNPR